MKKILEGLKKFSNEVHHHHQDLFETLSQGQKPHTLFITCSDSRIDPCLITQSHPGELFVLRNAGNIIPPHGASQGGEEATIEFALKGLDIQHIAVCGHTHCGAMSALMQPDKLEEMSSVRSWLKHAELTRKICLENYKEKYKEKYQENFQWANHHLQYVIEENVKVQINHLKTYPCVEEAMKKRKLSIFGMNYHIENGVVRLFNPHDNSFIPTSDLEFQSEKDLKRFACL